MVNFETISPKENRPESHSGEPLSQEGLARRDLLKGLGAAAAIAAVGPKIVELAKNIDDKTIFSDEEQEQLDAAIAKIAARTEPTETQKNIEQRDLNIIGETFAQQIESGEDIKLDQATRNAVYKHHYDEYKPGGPNHEENLIKGLERMDEWVAEIKGKFSNHNIDEKFIYLAIAESGFRTDAVSPDAAVGPYQIIPKTALGHRLIMTDSYDERLDPIRSAELCVNHLKDGLKKSSGDESFALMDYNGGYTKQYILDVINNEKSLSKGDIKSQKNKDGNVKMFTLPKKGTLEEIANTFGTSVTRLKIKNSIQDIEVRKLQPGKKLIIPEGRKITFEKFNTWLEHRINTRIKEESKKYKYTVRSGDTLGLIAQRYNEDIQEIMTLNNLPTTVIQLKQKLRLPSLEKNRKENTLKILSDYRENINYPDKFYAIFDIIKQEKLSKQFDNATTNYREISPPSESTHSFQHTIQKGDSLSHIVNLLKKQNPTCTLSKNKLILMFVKQNTNIPSIHKVTAGKSIKLQFSLKLPGSLTDIAKEEKVDIQVLRSLNPAVLNEHVSLPKGVLIRIPQ